MTDFRVPAVDWQRTAARVLTTEWIDGTPIRDPAALEAAGHDPKRIAVLRDPQLPHPGVARRFLPRRHASGKSVRRCAKAGSSPSISASWAGSIPPCAASWRRRWRGFLARDYMRVARSPLRCRFRAAHASDRNCSRRRCARSASRFSAAAHATSRWRNCCSNCSTPRAASTCSCSRSSCSCRRQWWWWKAWRAALDPDFDIWEASRPVVERWMIEHMGPEARLRDAAEGMSALGRLARELPQLLRNAEIVSAMLAEGGLRLHPDTARQICRGATRAHALCAHRNSDCGGSVGCARRRRP